MTRTVAIDVTPAVTQRAGVGRYTRELVRALSRLPDAPHLCPFYVAPRVAYPLDLPVPLAAIPRSVRSWRLEVLLRHALHWSMRGPWDGAHLYHAPDVVFPPLCGLPVVTTVHDLSYIVYPQYHTRLNGGYLRLLTPQLMRRARLIIAVSKATRQDLIECLGVPERKIRVVYTGTSPLFTVRPPEAVIADVRARYGLTGPFILSVGTLEPRKNLSGTLQAYRLLRQRMPDAPLLALAGGSGWKLDAQQLAAAGVLRLGFVPDADLAALYAACSAFVYLSFYEGWGLPVAEALSLGAPVVASRTSSLPEVAGDAALLVDPHAPEEIAAALERVLGDRALAARLRAVGPRQVAPFTLEHWAAATRDVYCEALE